MDSVADPDRGQAGAGAARAGRRRLAPVVRAPQLADTFGIDGVDVQSADELCSTVAKGLSVICRLLIGARCSSVLFCNCSRCRADESAEEGSSWRGRAAVFWEKMLMCPATSWRGSVRARFDVASAGDETAPGRSGWLCIGLNRLLDDAGPGARGHDRCGAGGQGHPEAGRVVSRRSTSTPRRADGVFVLKGVGHQTRTRSRS